MLPISVSQLSDAEFFMERISQQRPGEIAHRVIARSRDIVGAIWRRVDDPDAFLRLVRGVIHVGANAGQERDIYASHGLYVIWIEPISEVFDQLQKNLLTLPRQRAMQYLVSDEDGKEYEFHVANNGGASSSILELNLHRDIWPDVAFESTIRLRSVTLDALVERGEIDSAMFQALVLDTQGSELLVLRGASRLLRNLQFIKAEAADFDSYLNCAKADELIDWLRPHGFVLRHQVAFARHPGGGRYYDLLFARVQ
jgi:FkbM family methyltransferase